MHPSDLEIAVRSFKAMHPELSTPAGAMYGCVDASAAFLDLLMDTELIGREPEQGDWELMEVPSLRPDDCAHHVVRLGRTLVDWTARQFDPDAPWPKVWMEENIRLPDRLCGPMSGPHRGSGFTDEKVRRSFSSELRTCLRHLLVWCVYDAYDVPDGVPDHEPVFGPITIGRGRGGAG